MCHKLPRASRAASCFAARTIFGPALEGLLTQGRRCRLRSSARSGRSILAHRNQLASFPSAHANALELPVRACASEHPPSTCPRRGPEMSFHPRRPLRSLSFLLLTGWVSGGLGCAERIEPSPPAELRQSFPEHAAHVLAAGDGAPRPLSPRAASTRSCRAGATVSSISGWPGARRSACASSAPRARARSPIAP